MAVLWGCDEGFKWGLWWGYNDGCRLCREAMRGGCTGWSMKEVMMEHVMGHDGGHVSRSPWGHVGVMSGGS